MTTNRKLDVLIHLFGTLLPHNFNMNHRFLNQTAWACKEFVMDGLQLRGTPEGDQVFYGEHTGYAALSEFFGIDMAETYFIFNPETYDIEKYPMMKKAVQPDDPIEVMKRVMKIIQKYPI